MHKDSEPIKENQNDPEYNDDSDETHRDPGDRADHESNYEREINLTYDRDKADYSLFDKDSEYDNFINPDREKKERERNDHIGFMERSRDFFVERQSDIDKMLSDIGIDPEKARVDFLIAEYKNRVIQCTDQRMANNGYFNIAMEQMLSSLQGLSAVGAGAWALGVSASLGSAAYGAAPVIEGIVLGGVAGGVAALGGVGAVAIAGGITILGGVVLADKIYFEHSKRLEGATIMCRNNTHLFNY